MKKRRKRRVEVYRYKGRYSLIYMPEHPSCQKNGTIMEHRVIVERNIGRYLTGVEVVHHINGIKDDNRIENLQLCADYKEHQKLHIGLNKVKENNEWFKICPSCKLKFKLDADNFQKKKNGGYYSYCRKCSSQKSLKYYYKKDKRNEEEKKRLKEISRKYRLGDKYKEYILKNKDKMKEKNLKYYNKNKAELNRRKREKRKNKLCT